jgi:general secretion pathway protein A
MYKEYFGLEELPFSIAPDPRYLYMSEQHREALAHLLYGIKSDGGFVLLTGDVGTGKTTVCRCLLEQIPENHRIAFIINPKITVIELLAAICDEFGIDYPKRSRSVKVFVDRINAFLLDVRAGGGRAVVIVDEAQNLDAEVLEQLRLLTNLETSQEKLLQIVLLGQPELRNMLIRPELRQLDQRITARFHLGPLPRNDVDAYVTHRLRVAGVERKLFGSGAIRKLYRLSGGIPRLINVVCDRALIGAYVQGQNTVTSGTLGKAADEVFGQTVRSRPVKARPWLLAAGLAAALIAAAFHYGLFSRGESTTTEVTETAVPPLPAEEEQTDAPRASEAPTTTAAVGTLAPAATGGETEESAPGVVLDWLKGGEGRESRDGAFRTLFQLWGAFYDPDDGQETCLQAEAQGLMCLSGRASLDDLGRLNRPAVLKLSDKTYTTLTALHEQKASLSVGGETREVTFHWYGDYTLLWRPPPEYRQDLFPGDGGPLVKWLESRLALRDEGYSPRNTRIYDAVMVDEIKRFQAAEGLAVDGIVGPQTLIRLNTGFDRPLLHGGGGDV